MTKIDQKAEKRAKNEAFADKYKKADKESIRKARKLRRIDESKAREEDFWAAEAKRRDYPVK